MEKEGSVRPHIYLILLVPQKMWKNSNMFLYFYARDILAKVETSVFAKNNEFYKKTLWLFIWLPMACQLELKVKRSLW